MIKARPPPSSSDASSDPSIWILHPVIKSPLDYKQYKVIKLQNGLRATLVSTWKYQANNMPDDNDDPASSTDSNPDFLQREIDSFNKTHLGIESYSKLGDSIPPASLGNNNVATRQSTIHGSSTPKSKLAKVVPCSFGKATICVTVGAGSYNDPKSTPGLAHFVQRAVLLGSKQHPEPNKLFNKVYCNDGVVTATTAAEHTNFSFACDLSAFAESVHILVDYLTNPLFKDSDIVTLYQELEAANLENNPQPSSEASKINAFLRTRAKADHPFSFRGNNEKLPNVYDFKSRVCAWKQRFYKADYMTVCIHAPVPLETLEGFVLNHFADIPSAPVKALAPSAERLAHGKPFSQNEFQAIYRVVASDNQQACIILSWTLPPDIAKNCETKPLEYIRLMLQDTAYGGLSDYLRKKQWMAEWNNLNVSCPPSNGHCRSDFASFFSISISLTDKGQKEMSNVLKTVFSFLKLLYEQGVQLTYFEEMKRGAATKFHFQNWDEMLHNGVDIAESMQYTKPSQILTCSTLLTKWDEDVIKHCLKLLLPRTANYTCVAKENAVICLAPANPDEVRFRKLDMEESCYRVLEGIGIYPEFRLPPEGTFLLREITWTTGCTKEDIVRKICSLPFTSNVSIANTPDEKLPYLTARIPSAHYHVQFTVQGITEESLMEYWLRNVDDRVIQAVGHQFDHLFGYELGLNQNQVSIAVEGPQCHLPELVNIITIFLNSEWQQLQQLEMEPE